MGPNRKETMSGNICLFSKEKVSGTAVIKEVDTDSVLGYEKTDHFWFSSKKVLSIANSQNLFIECPSYISFISGILHILN